MLQYICPLLNTFTVYSVTLIAYNYISSRIYKIQNKRRKTKNARRKMQKLKIVGVIRKIQGIKKAGRKTCLFWCRWPDLNRHGCYTEGF